MEAMGEAAHPTLLLSSVEEAPGADSDAEGLRLAGADAAVAKPAGRGEDGHTSQVESRAGSGDGDADRRSASEEPMPGRCSDHEDEEDDDEEEEEESEEDEARAPDGGWGWVVVAAAFVTNLIADGVTFTFGIIYVDLLKYFKEGKSKTAWIGGLFMAMPLLSGPVASYLTDRYGCRRVCIFGAVLSALGFIVSSFATSIELLIVTFGIVSGFGLALCYVAAVVIVAYYFDKRRSLATGLSVCGSGIGTFVFAPLTASLIAEYGWRGTTLIVAGLFLNIAVCGALMRDLEWTKAKSRALRGGKRVRGADCAQRGQSQAPAPAPGPPPAPPLGADAKELRRLLWQRGDAPGCFQNETSSQQKRCRTNTLSDNANRHFNSVLNIPTYVCNGEKVPLEVLELLSTNQSEYRIHFKKFINPQQGSSTSFRDNATNPNQTLDRKKISFGDTKDHLSSLVIIPHPSTQQKSSIMKESESEKLNHQLPRKDNKEEGWCMKKTQENNQYQQRRATQCLRNLQVHRHSLIYRSAVLKVRRSRLRSSSCPDIYRNSSTQAKDEDKEEWYSCLRDLRDVVADMVDFSHFSDVRFVLFSISNFLLYSWYDVPYVFITDKATEMGFSEPDASFLISILGILNMLGVIILGWAGDQSWVNAGMVYAVCMAICGVVTGLVPLLSSYTGLCIMAGGFGLSISANYSLASIILVELITLDRFTNAYGLLLLVQGVANLIGPPLAGWLYDISGNYDLSFYLAGFFIILCGILLLVLPAMKWIDMCWNGHLKRKSTKSDTIYFPQNMYTKENNSETHNILKSVADPHP